MLNVAIIGVGAIAPAHIKAYQELSEQCNMVALCDIQPDKAKKRALRSIGWVKATLIC